MTHPMFRLLQQRTREMTVTGAPVPGTAQAEGAAVVLPVVTGSGSVVATQELGHE